MSGNLLYSGKAKKVFDAGNGNIVMHYKDDTTAYNGIKKAQIANKGFLNNQISSIIFKKLNEAGIPTHFIETLNEREQLCKYVEIIPLEIIVRNVIAGSLAKRLGLKEGTPISNVIFEINYKNDRLGDPMVNEDHAVAINACTYEEIKYIKEIALKVNNILKDLFINVGVSLIDVKLEFGRTVDGSIILADEISPDTSRLWDAKTHDKLDKDRFRKDLDHVIDAYKEVYNRLLSIK